MNRNKVRKDSDSFKKDVNRDVTQTDQREARERKVTRNKSTNKRNNKRGAKTSAEDTKYGYYSYRDNDFSWYSTKPELTAAAAQIPFSNWSGDIITPNALAPTAKVSIGGVMAIDVIPTLGVELQKTDPVNVAAEKLWAYIFHTVSGNAFADAQDMMIFLLGMCDVYSYIVWLQRLYGEMNLWSDQNSYLPKGFDDLERVNFSDLRSHRLEFAGYINTLIDQAAALCVPKQFTLFMRRAFLYQNLYTEGISAKSQLYAFTPRGYLQYGLNPDNQSGQLNFTPLPLTSTASQLYNYGQNMINALLADQDVKKLSSLILRAFGSEGIIRLNEMPFDFKTNIVYSLEVLEQIKNADIVPYDALTLASLNVTQNPATTTLMYNITTKSYPTEVSVPAASASYWYASKQEKYITTGLANPTPEMIVENTRLKVVYGPQTNMYSVGSVIPASEMAVGVRVIRFGTEGMMTISYEGNVFMVISPSNTVSSLMSTLHQKLNPLMSFKFRPSFNFVPYTTSGTPATSTYYPGMLDDIPLYDFDNWTVLRPEDLQRLNRIVMFNLLDNTTVAAAWSGR